MERKCRLIDDPEYVQGQIHALRAMVLALAQFVPKERFFSQCEQRFESLRTSLLASHGSDVQMTALEHTEEWLSKLR